MILTLPLEIPAGEPRVEVVVAFVDDGGVYPHASGDDPTLEYWRAIAVMAATLRIVGADWPITVATNTPPTDPDVTRTFASLGVACRITPFDHRPPVGYFDRFSGSFFLLDALADAVARNDEATVLIFVDPDCVWVRDPAPIVRAIAAHPQVLLAYEIHYSLGQPAIGRTQEELGQLFADLGGAAARPRPPYAGGEVLAGTCARLADLLPHIERIWAESLRRFEEGEPIRANTEEHVLSYALAQEGWSGGTANRFVRRLWTRLPPDRNVQGDEDTLVLWHVLREKGRGLSVLFQDVVAEHPSLQVPGRRYRRHLARRLSVRLSPLGRAKWVVCKVLYGRSRPYPVEW